MSSTINQPAFAKSDWTERQRQAIVVNAHPGGRFPGVELPPDWFTTRDPRVEIPSSLPSPGDLPGMIFFDWDSDVPPVDAGQTAAFVARNAGPCGWSSFGATGHADRSGSDAYNVELSRRRAEAVASLLASAGIPRASITTDARGEEQPRVPTADGVREPQNRRVEITVR